mmetsp:Transcript_36118/g.94985  ORF Transcript_36118/g.94985 Transcript_36118/m.94985 type:complete len:193 (+) Transcript_36118:470-1048(+)
MGTKKAVYSHSISLEEYYGPGERRCERPAVEWTVDGQMQRKKRVPDLEDRRNGLGQACPGDKPYSTAEYAPEYKTLLLADRLQNGSMDRKVMSKIDKSWSQSGSNPLLDKKGRRMCDYIQVYCRTAYRKNSMYVHRKATVQEVIEMAAEGGGANRRVLMFKGEVLPHQATVLECGVRAKSTLDLVEQVHCSH